MNNFISSDDDAAILLCKVDNPSQFGIAEIENDKIIKLTEKPKKPPSNLAVTGIYFLTPLIFDLIDKLKPSWRNELEIVDALQMLLDINHKVRYYMITDMGYLKIGNNTFSLFISLIRAIRFLTSTDPNLIKQML